MLFPRIAWRKRRMRSQKYGEKYFFVVLRSENCFPFSVYLDFSSVIRIIRLTSPEVEWKWTDKDQIKILFAIFKVARDSRDPLPRQKKIEKWKTSTSFFQSSHKFTIDFFFICEIFHFFRYILPQWLWRHTSHNRNARLNVVKCRRLP